VLTSTLPQTTSNPAVTLQATDIPALRTPTFSQERIFTHTVREMTQLTAGDNS
jgi:hypothetical protein